MPRLFKFYLQDAAGNYYYYDVTYGVLKSTTKRPLRNSPSNWESIKIQYGRNEKYFGVFRKSAEPIQFIKDGRDILRSIYYENGQANFDAYCLLTIEKRNDTGTNVWAYDAYYQAEIDFANSMDDGVNENGDFFQVNLLERGLQEILNNKENTPYEVDFEGGTDINTDGLPLRVRYEWQTGQLGGFDIRGDRAWIFPMAQVSYETADYFRYLIFPGTQYGETIGTLTQNTPTPSDTNRFLATDLQLTNVNFSLTGSVTVELGNFDTAVNFTVRQLRKNMQDNDNDFAELVAETISPNTTETININVQASNFVYDPKIYGYYMVMGINAGNPSNNPLSTITINNMKLTIDFASQLPATTTRALPYYDFTKKVVNKMAPGYTFASSYLSLNKSLSELPRNGYYNNLPSYTFVTSGDGLRQINNANIKTTFDDIFQDIYSRWMCGVGLEGNTLRIENLPYFFQAGNVIATLDEIASFKKYTASDWIYNLIKTGYINNDLDKLNARAEVNSEQVYSLPIKRVSKELDIISPYRADVYGIEYTRSDYFGRNTTDSKADNQTFLLEAFPYLTSGKHNLVRYPSDPNQQVFGVPFPEGVFNVGLSPHRFVLRHIPYWRSILNVPQGTSPGAGQITLQTATKNRFFATYIDNEYIQEERTIYAGATTYYNPSKLFIPVIFEFEAQPPYNLLKLIEQNPYGEIAFIDKGITYYGFILDAGITPATKDVYTFRLLCSPSTDTNNLK